MALASPLLGLPSMDADRDRVEAALLDAVRTRDAYLTEIASHLIVAGGKRLRPVMTVAAAQVGGQSPVSDEVILGGISCELVHLGSLYHDDVMDESPARRGVETVNAKWGNLQAILAGDFRRENRALLEIRFADGTFARGQAVIAADGVHSPVREQLLGPEHAHFTGKVAYRTTFKAARMKGVHVPTVRTKWWGADRHMVIYPVTANRDEIYFVTSQPEKAEWRTAESWSAKGDLDELRASFAGFHAEVQAVLNAAAEVHKWALFERDPLPRWSLDGGRVVLLGDACHPMTPYMAQGAASALEDAMVLSRCMDGVDSGGVADAFRRYEATRKPRASRIQMQSGKNTWLKGEMKGETDPAWVYGYDACTADLAA